MNSNLGGGGSRSQKMLSMVGLRLKKVSDCSRPQWKVCSPSTVVNAELNVSYEVSNFESEDVLEEPVINNLENESTMQESDRPVATESGEPQPKVSYEVSSFEYKDISEEPVNKNLKNEQTMSELDMPVATESGKPQPKVNYEVSNFDSEVVFAEPVINELENGHTMHELDMRVATESGEPQPKVLNPIIITDLPNYEASSFEPQVILPELVSSLSERNVSNGKVSQLESSSSNSSDSEEAFSSDDSVQDPNYSSDSSSSSGSSSENDENIIEMTGERKKTRKRKAVPSEWKKNCAKRLRNSGKSYTTLGKGLLMPERQLKPPCNDKCKLICSNKFTEEERLSIFENYWKMTDIVKQRTYILTLIQEINPKYRYTRQVNGRATNHAFYFFNDNKKIRVCKHFFIATLGITNRCIRTVKAKIKNNTLGEDNRGKHANHKEVSREIKDGVRSHISSIPTIESHYTRADSEKVYIEGSKTIAQLHRDYRSECEAQGIPYANLTMYRNIFNNEYNIAFFVPKKDQCQTCVSYQNSNEDEKKASEIEYNCHIEEKNLSRAEKTRDKNRISPLFQVACFDLEASLPTPNGQVSSFYYRSKLSTYNFTVCDITQKGQGPVNCYMWHEAEGKRGANEIGTCLLNYLKEKAEASNSNELEITLYSDNCAGQQKNKFVITAFLYAVTNYNIKSITHKYLVTGHTQNEGDNVHSLIEKNIKRALKSSPIYTPSQYVGLVQTAKKTGYPFKVVELAYSDFLDLKNLTEQTCSNFNKNSLGENFKLSDMSILKVEKENLGRFFYKTSFKDTDYKEQSHKSYRPLCVLTFRLNYLFGQLEPIGYHLVNMLLHSVVCLMYFRMCSMFLPILSSFVAAMLFAVHPIHTEAVTGVVGRAETLSSVFFLAAFIFYSKATKNRKCTEWKYIALSMFSIATAMLCKEQGITIAGVCATYEIFVIQKVKLEDIKHFLKSAVTAKSSYHFPKSNAAAKRLFVLAVTTLLLLLARLQIMGSQLPVFTRFDNPASVAPSPARQLSYHYLISVNLWLLLFPCNLCCDWTMGTIPLVESFMDARNLATVVTYFFLLILVGTALMTENRHQSVVLIMSTSLLVLPFMPASNLFFPVGFVVAERVLYMPSMGFCMLIGYGWQVLCKKAGKKLAWTFVCLLILSHGAKTYLRNWDWENEYTIFMSGLRVNQRNAKLFNNVGHALESQGKFEEALQFFKTAVQVQHDDVGAYINVGRTYNHLKMYKEAEEAYLKAKSLLPKAKPGESYQARIAPNHLNVFLNLANLISKNHTRLEEADMLYRQAISMRADYTQAYINRGDILIKLNRTKEAQEVYERALLYDSNNPDIYYNLGVVFLEQGKASQALAYLDKALEIDPEHEQALLNSAILLQEFGRPEFRKTARERLLKLLSKDKNNERVHFNLGMLAMDDKDISEAEYWFRRAVHLKADFRSALFNLALLLADDQRPLEAAPFLNQLVKYHPDHVKGLILLGDIYINNIKDLDAAENCYRKILELEPDNIQGLHNLCVVHVERGKLLDAQKCLEEAHRLAPEEDYIIKHLTIVQNRIQKFHLNEDVSDAKEKSKVVSNKSVDENEKKTQPVVSKDTEKQRYSSRVENTEPMFVKDIDNTQEYTNFTIIEDAASVKSPGHNSSLHEKQRSVSDNDDPSSGMS